jgi:hypothetical protein
MLFDAELRRLTSSDYDLTVIEEEHTHVSQGTLPGVASHHRRRPQFDHRANHDSACVWDRDQLWAIGHIVAILWALHKAKMSG